MQIAGRCRCGNVAYEAAADPDAVGICHCTDCRTLSGSPVAIPAAATDFVLLRGGPQIEIRTAESGTKRAPAFCADCGTPICAADTHEPPIDSLRIGAIRQRPALRPGRQVSWRSALPWSMDISALETRDGE